MISSTDNHVWNINISYKYIGKTSDGTPWEHEFEIPVTVNSSTQYYYPSSGIIDCNKGAQFFYTWKGYDATAKQEADARAHEESGKEIIRGLLESEAQVRQENERRQRQIEAKAEARRQEDLARQEELNRSKRALENLQKQKEAYQAERERAIIQADPDPQCRMAIDLAGLQACRKSRAIEKQFEISRAAREAEVAAAANRMQEASRAEIERASQAMEANNCSFSAGFPATIPYPKINSNEAAYRAEVKRADELNAAAQKDFWAKIKSASDACDARKSAKAAAQLRERQQLQEAAQREQQLEAQRKARAELDRAVQNGKQTLSDTQNKTQAIQNSNAELLEFLKQMK
jgi:hypothetical protein